MKVLISACLLGIPCRYDGKRKKYDNIIKLHSICELIPFCPECYGGLPTPRVPAEISGDKVISENGNDVTSEYIRGAQAALSLCKEMGIRYALLKEKSPSCGKGLIYDGTFSKTLTAGNGITAKLLMENGIKVFGESETEDLLREIGGASI